MPVESFLDTHAAAGRNEHEVRRDRALALIEREDFGLSAQVLQEFYVTVTRKIAVPLRPEQALQWVEQFEGFPCLPIDSSLVKIAAEISESFGISYWDGAIVAAADSLGARILYTEDLNDGQHYGSVRVLDPFQEKR